MRFGSNEQRQVRCRMRCGTNRQRKRDGRRWLLNHANGVSGHGNSPPTRKRTKEFLPQREERADIGKDDVVEARKWIPNTPYIINTRARRCACIFIRLAAIKASNCIIVSLDSRRRFILAVYPPKFGRRLCEKTHVFAHKFPRNSIRSLLRILHLIAFSRMNRWFYIINNRSVISCASTDLQNGCL